VTSEAQHEGAPNPGAGALVDPDALEHNRNRVQRSFWRKLRRVMSQIPFAEDAVAMYFCALDQATPLRVRATLFAALAYFVIPADLVPDFIAGLGYGDDASVIAAALALVASHITPAHRARARRALDSAEARSAGED
jgi:uncharacterized membrane protein YkvA (DUF1232 family)